MRPANINLILAYLTYFIVGVAFVSSIPYLKSETSFFLILITTITGNYLVNRAALNLNSISNLLLSNICALFSSMIMVIILTLILCFTEYSIIKSSDLPSPIAPLAIIYLVINLIILELLVHFKKVKYYLFE